MPVLRPFENDKSATRITVPSAYRAWAYWANVVGYGCLQVGAIRVANLDEATENYALCEVYSRAVFETQMGLHFDSTDSKCDQAVLILIRECFSAERAARIHGLVSAVGPVIRDYDGALQDALLSAATEAQEAMRDEMAAARAEASRAQWLATYCSCSAGFPTRRSDVREQDICTNCELPRR